MTKSVIAPVASDFASEVGTRLERLASLAADGGLDEAIGLMTRAIEAGAVIRPFGTGHSEAFAMEIAGRAGGLIPTNKIALRDVVLRGSLPVDALTGSRLERNPDIVAELWEISPIHTRGHLPHRLQLRCQRDRWWAWHCWPKRRATTSSR